MKKILGTLIVCLIASFAVSAAFADTKESISTGNIRVGSYVSPYTPSFLVGYTNGSWQATRFAGFGVDDGIFRIPLTSLATADRGSTTVVSNVLNGFGSDGQEQVVSKAVIDANTTLVVINHASNFEVTNRKATAFFPSIWVKGDVSINTSAETYLDDGTANQNETKKFWNQGLTIQAPYSGTATQWQLYVYAASDVISGAVPTGSNVYRVLSPEVSTLTWYATGEAENNEGRRRAYQGIPYGMWAYKPSGIDTKASFYNTIPICTSSNNAVIRSYLTGTSGLSIPENFSSMATTTVANVLNNSINPTTTYYVSDRVKAERGNGFTVGSGSHAGLIFAANSTSNQTSPNYSVGNFIFHMFFSARWPDALGSSVTSGEKKTTLWFYQQTTY